MNNKDKSFWIQSLRFDRNQIENGTKLPQILVVLGTRPEAIKLAPLIAELRSDEYCSRWKVVVVSTGQHQQMLHQTLTAFEQTIDIDLDLMTYNQKLSDLFIRVFAKIGEQIDLIRPDLLIVQGDTTTALASALAAAYHPIPVAHVEAGLRSFNLLNPYPEELNRKIIDSFAKLMFPPTTFAREALLREGACESDVFVTGNTGVDAFYRNYKHINTTRYHPVLKIIDTFKKRLTTDNDGTIILVTMHRRENFDHMVDMCRAVATIAREHEKTVLIVLPVHPNPNVRNVVLTILNGIDNVKIVDPISYETFGHVLSRSDIIMTDSGGIQEEASNIGKPVILMRMTTERPEGIYFGTIKQIGIVYHEIIQAVRLQLTQNKSTNRTLPTNIFGDGTASKKIAAIIANYLYEQPRSDTKCMTKTRQDSIANVVYSDLHGSHKNIASHTIRQSMIKNLTKVRPALTLTEILTIPSKYYISKRHEHTFALTAIIGLYRREGLVRRWIEALLAQTHPPTEIWFTYFASPISHKLKTEIEQVRFLFSNESNYCHEWCTAKKCKIERTIGNETLPNCFENCLNFCRKLPSILVVGMGEMQLKYFGRFQLALQCRTKYLVVFDDDCIPQRQYFEIAMHTINTEEYRGILGTKGTPALGNIFYGPVSKSNRIIEVDVVGGSWFLESDWIKLMFHDKMYSWETGEDFHLSANARKYANIRSFVMPVDEKQISTHSFSPDYLTVSDKGDTTGRVAGTASSRTHIKNQLWLRGDRLMHSYKTSKPSLLIFAETHDDATMLITHTYQQMNQLEGSIHFATSNTIRCHLDISYIKKSVQSFHDFMIGRNYDVDPTPITTAAEVLYAFDMVMQGTQSTAVMIVGSSSTIAMFALVSAAFIRNIPIINLYQEDTIIDTRRSQAIWAISSIIIRFSPNQTLNTFEYERLNNSLVQLYK